MNWLFLARKDEVASENGARGEKGKTREGRGKNLKFHSAIMRNVVLAEQQEEKIIKNPRGDVSMRRKRGEVRWRVEIHT